MVNLFYENTNDYGWIDVVSARDNSAAYAIRSARAHDLYDEYVEKYQNSPTSRWLHRNIGFGKAVRCESHREAIYLARHRHGWGE